MSADRFRAKLPNVSDRITVVDRLRVVRKRWRLLLRLAGATSASFAIATYIFGHEQAFFAPIAAVIVLLAGVGLRQRMLFELILGVAVGVLVGELLILGIGRGVWQLALIVVITTITASFAGLKGVALTQAANSGVLLATVIPVAGAANPAVTRFIDALVGGLCAVAMILLLPRNPTRDIALEVRPLLVDLQAVLRDVARAMRTSDPALAHASLTRARGLQNQINSAMNTAANVREVAVMSPVRWRQRPEVERYAGVLTDVDNAIRDARVLARRVSTMMRLGEQPGEQLTSAVEQLAHGIGVFQDGLAQPSERAHGEEALIESVRMAMEALTGEMTLNRAAVAAQIRSLAADMLFASGMTRDELDVRLRF
ncbi:FUSC family protein [Nocardioides gilvus]|uniref:FUSC family protein n=1 Tax=Nocardioides gilvus TaxID=1735589 RepID=UPI0013A57F4F|nr:FUSC family protein [Nocardioides gilvus]